MVILRFSKIAAATEARNLHHSKSRDVEKDNYRFFYPQPFEIYMNESANHKNSEGMTAFNGIGIAIRPWYGAHRQEADVVMAVATGCQLPEIIYFDTSLLSTGFDGDIVLGLGDDISNETKDFGKYYAKHHNLVLYEIPLLACTGAERFRLCNSAPMYEAVYQNGTRRPLPDIRPPRCVAQLRYEYYWAWVSSYLGSSRVLISDVRDVFFQRNPFQNLPRNATMETTLHVYRDTETIESNIPESNWIRNIYNESFFNEIKDQPGLCSGTSLGGKPSMEMYFRAMIKENDLHGNQKSCGMDQGRHIALIRTNRLFGAPNITRVIEYNM